MSSSLLVQSIKATSSENDKTRLVVNFVKNGTLINKEDAITIGRCFVSDVSRTNYVYYCATMIESFASIWVEFIKQTVSDSSKVDIVRIAARNSCLVFGDPNNYSQQVAGLVKLLSYAVSDSSKRDIIKLYSERIQDWYITCEQCAQIVSAVISDSSKIEIVKILAHRILDEENASVVAGNAVSNYARTEILRWISGLEKPFTGLNPINPHTTTITGPLSIGGALSTLKSENGFLSLTRHNINAVISNSNPKMEVNVIVSEDYIEIDDARTSGGIRYGDVNFSFCVRNGRRVCVFFDNEGKQGIVSLGKYTLVRGSLYDSLHNPVKMVDVFWNTDNNNNNNESAKVLPGEITEKDVQNDPIIKEEIENPCEICCDRQRSALLLPCRHSKLCVTCAWDAKQKNACPFCRGSITNVLKIF